MEAKVLKEKIVNGQVSEEELRQILAKRVITKGGFIKAILKGFNDGYTVPMARKLIIESLLILSIIIGTIILSYTNKIDSTVTAALLAVVLGYIFGKIR
jgi:hypothetical protein